MTLGTMLLVDITGRLIRRQGDCGEGDKRCRDGVSIFWGGFNTAMEATNTMKFCVSCHEMEETRKD